MGYMVGKIRRGDTFEYECSRTTHRIHATRAILESIGVDFTPKFKGEVMTAHEDTCNRSPRELANTAFGWRDRLVCNCNLRNARPELPEWLTDETINAAANLADNAISARGAFNRSRKG